MNALVPVQIIEGEIIPPGDYVRVVGMTHPLLGKRILKNVPAGLTVAEILEDAAVDTRFPLVVHVDGEAIPPEWRTRTRVKPGTVVTFRPRLQGDNPLRTILSLALVVATMVFAPFGAGLLGLTAGTFAFNAASALISGGIILAGTLALNALFPVRAPESITAKNLNSISGAQNQGAPFGPVPVVLGKHRQSPFYAAKPYTEIIGDDQYLRLLFAFGYGPMSLSDHKIGETPLASFDGFEIEVKEGYATDTSPTLYPGQVDEQALSIELLPPTWESRTTDLETDEFSLDFTCPEGIYESEGSGTNPWAVVVEYRWRPVGAGNWTGSSSTTMTSSYSAVRRGVRVQVARGQYEVQCARTSGFADVQFNIREKTIWTALRSLKNVSPVHFAQPLTLVSMRIRATEQLSGVVDTYNAICESKGKGFNGGDWIDDRTSQNPADLYRVVLQGPANARPRQDVEIDLANLEEWWAYCTANGFKFNQVRSSVSSVWDTLSDIAAAGRAVPTFIDGKWGVIWDRPTDPIVQHFTPRNSWGLTGERAYAQQPHGWRAKFINEVNGYTQDERIVYDDGFDETNAHLFEGIEFPGVTDPDLIWKHGRFHIAQSRLRPEKVTLSVGWENLICTRGDRVRVTHDVLMIGNASGRVTEVTGQVVTFDEPVTIEAGKTYAFRYRLPGDTRSLLRAVAAIDPNDFELPLVPGVYTSLRLVGDTSEISVGDLWGFGETDQDSAVYRVYGITHQKDLIANLVLVDDAPETSEADQGTIPTYDSHTTLPVDPLTIFIQALTANFRQGVAEPVLDATWRPVSGDQQIYTAEISYDAREVGDDAASWRQIYEGPDNKFAIVVDAAALRLRVRAKTGGRSGGFTAIDVDPPTIVVAPGTVNYESFTQALKDTVASNLAEGEKVDKIIQVIGATVAQALSAIDANKRILRSTIAAREGVLGASIEQVQTIAVTANEAVAQLETEVEATFGEQSASITENSTAIATIGGKLAAQWTVSLDVNNRVSGLRAVDDGTTAGFTISTDIFELATPSTPGVPAVKPFQISTVGGLARITYRGDMYADGSINAQALNVAKLDAVSGNMGTLTAGEIRSPDGNFLIDATNKRIVISG